MVTVEHESPIQIVRDHPEVLVQLLRTAFDIKVPDDIVVRTVSEDFTQITPAAYRADNVVEIRERGSPTPKISVVAETQRAVDPRKCRSWPVYLTALHARSGCPSYLLVFCPARRVADWARKPVVIGHPGFTLTPLVVGPGTGPLVTSTAQAAEMPELTIVAALTNVSPHTEESLEITHAALATIENTGHENATLYTDMVLGVLPQAARKILEELVTTGTADYKFKSDFALRNQAIGEARGQAIGEARGQAIGEARGQAIGEAKMLLLVLEGRGLCVSDEMRERITTCADERQLAEWGRRAGTAESADDIFS
ncbi:hypothetical protein [Actinomadura macra]|uniref:hypothetical protein n=1 Tax=Actinomadura macra TaxID=46164 RepID=UPI000829DE04|nr:hypothetical protein [Actinomadura macra]